MTSHDIEDRHNKGIDQLLADANLECLRIRTPEEEELSLEAEFHESIETIPEEESVKSESKTEEPEPEPAPKVRPRVFPTPSLRRVIPKSQRLIEEDNRIHVLPEKFKINVDPLMIPKIKITPPKVYIDTLAEMTGCHAYSYNYPEYWFLDTLANLLRRAQEDYLCLESQATLIRWFCEWMKEMQNFDAADRARMIRRHKDNMLEAAKYVAAHGVLPAPEDIGVYYQQKKVDADSVPPPPPPPPMGPAGDVKLDSNLNACPLIDLAKITHYLYDLISTDYQYNLIRSIFTFGPDITHIKSEFGINRPKKLYVVAKVKPPKPAKPPKETKKKEEKGKKKVEGVETPPAYHYLMEVKAFQEKELEEQQEKEREEWNLRNSILPLSFADTQELADEYWPPPEPLPPPPPPVVEEAPTPKKGKKK